jgi:hypothetical protein
MGQLSYVPRDESRRPRRRTKTSHVPNQKRNRNDNVGTLGVPHRLRVPRRRSDDIHTPLILRRRSDEARDNIEDVILRGRQANDFTELDGCDPVFVRLPVFLTDPRLDPRRNEGGPVVQNDVVLGKIDKFHVFSFGWFKCTLLGCGLNSRPP